MILQDIFYHLCFVCWGTIMLEMITPINPPEREEMIFSDIDIIASFHSYIFLKEV